MFFLTSKCDARWSGVSLLLRHALHQLSVYLLEAWPLLGVPPPAAQHEIVVDSLRASVRPRQIHLAAQDKKMSVGLR